MDVSVANPMTDPEWREFYRLTFDGGISGGNPGGVINYGWLIVDELSTVITSGSFSGADPEYPETTNNIAEYMALRAGLQGYFAMPKTRDIPLIINGDSKLVINQVQGDWQVRNPGLKSIHKQCVQSIALITVEYWIYWIPRRLNSKADELGRQANDRRKRDDQARSILKQYVMDSN